MTLQCILSAAIVVGSTAALWVTGYIVQTANYHTIAVLRSALTRDGQGRLTLRKTPQLLDLQSQLPGLWFVIRDRVGNRLSKGNVPPELVGIGDSLSHVVAEARFALQPDTKRTDAFMVRAATAAGDVQILVGADPLPVVPREFLSAIGGTFVYGLLPNLLFMTGVMLIAVPFVVRKSLAGMADVAAQADLIDFDQRGTRLSEKDVPTEVGPLVKAVNDALARLDEGYERHKHFLVAAAHELRTPIAILQTRSESLPPGAARTRIQEDIGRLATLAEQLLDLQRLTQLPESFACVDLVAVGRRVAADMAPLAIAAGYEMRFDTNVGRVDVHGDEAAVERAVTNLVGNAIEHGDRRGAIAISVSANGEIDVTDEGPGVPMEHRERIFEPFYRVQSLDRGTGLGLNLVREIVTRHGGHVEALASLSGGACFRISLPLRAAISDP